MIARWKLASMPVAVLLLGSPLLLPSCRKPTAVTAATTASASKGPAVSCDEIKTGDFSAVQIIATTDIQSKMRRLMSVGYELGKTGKVFERGLIDACAEIGKAAGAADMDLKAEPNDGKGAEKVCVNAAAKVEKILKTAREDKVEITIEWDKPRCYVDVDAHKKCLAECGSATSADVRAACTGGEISGKCRGRCGGACINDPGSSPQQILCHGVCSGKCERDFRGTCGGRCDGTCNGLPTHGRPCAGVCDGSCSGKGEGVCQGACTGSCNGEWEQRDPTRCNGRCEGACAGGDLDSPVCSGDFKPPEVDPACQGACAARATGQARCEAPSIRINAKNGKQTVELQRLFAALQAELPKIVRLREGTSKRLARAIDGMIQTGVEMTNANALAGDKALFCVRTASDGAKVSEDTVDASVKGSEALIRALKAGL